MASQTLDNVLSLFGFTSDSKWEPFPFLVFLDHLSLLLSVKTLPSCNLGTWDSVLFSCQPCPIHYQVLINKYFSAIHCFDLLPSHVNFPGSVNSPSSVHNLADYFKSRTYPETPQIDALGMLPCPGWRPSSPRPPPFSLKVSSCRVSFRLVFILDTFLLLLSFYVSLKSG